MVEKPDLLTAVSVHPGRAKQPIQRPTSQRKEPVPFKPTLPDEGVLEVRNFSLLYSGKPALEEINLKLPERKISAIIGPSGCGKSSLLRAFNRMNEFIPNVVIRGKVLYRGEDIYARSVDPVEVRRRIGMVFQKPNPFPKSIFKNVSWGLSINRYQGDIRERVETALRSAALWEEVHDDLNRSALALSGGQQQRLCIARAIAMEPDVILMDEPCSALDPVATARIEDLLYELQVKYTIVIVTHNMQQAARVSEWTAFLNQGKLIEFGPTEQIFTNPKKKETADYVMGRFG